MASPLRPLAYCLIVVLGFAASTARADLVVIGPGTAGAPGSADGSGTRLNIDGTPVLLTAGDWTAAQVTYDSGTAGTFIPFLAVSTGTNTYSIIAVGGVITTTGVQNDITVDFGGGNNSLFTLASDTLVFAGFQSTGSVNPITFVNGGSTDHDNPGLVLPGQLVVGATPTFSNADLGRTYQFSVTAVPEPGTIALGTLALTGLAVGIRRRKTASLATAVA